MNSGKFLSRQFAAAFFAIGLFFLGSSQAAYAQKKAVVFVSPGLSSYDKWYAADRIVEEKNLLENLGYSVEQKIGSASNILNALMSKRYKAMSYFGHAVEPSMESVDAKGWKNKVFVELNRKYTQQNLPKAFQKANAESQNFGLELVRNNSCYSLSNTTLAHQFVKEGGLYYGVKGKFAPCFTVKALLYDVSWNLTAYRVPAKETETPVKTTTKSGSGLKVKIVMTCGEWGSNGQYAFPASGVKVSVGGQTLITKGGTARVNSISPGSVKISVPGKSIVSVVITNNATGRMQKINSPKSAFTVNLPPTRNSDSSSHYSVAIRLIDCDE